jgi:hypothetical protein
MSQVRSASFVVRVVQDRRGQVSGVIERVATGAKEAFTGMEVVGRVIVRMLRRGGPLPVSAAQRRRLRGAAPSKPAPVNLRAFDHTQGGCS